MTKNELEQLRGAQKEFYVACLIHDLTFEMSDDHRVWSKGRDSLTGVRVLARQLKLKRPRIVEIWNSVVALKLVESCREQFYW